MWNSSRKYIFRNIFKNANKCLKIFYEIFSKMQPNTLKYFLFQKILSLENILWLEIFFCKTKHNLNLISWNLMTFQACIHWYDDEMLGKEYQTNTISSRLVHTHLDGIFMNHILESMSTTLWGEIKNFLAHCFDFHRIQ